MKFKGMTFGRAFEEVALRKWAEMVMGQNDPEPSTEAKIDMSSIEA